MKALYILQITTTKTFSLMIQHIKCNRETFTTFATKHTRKKRISSPLTFAAPRKAHTLFL